MELIKDLARAVGSAAKGLEKKHRKLAQINRLRAVLRCEERAARKEYLALGRYYYNALRDPQNPIAEAHCKNIDGAEQRLDKALSQMQDILSSENVSIEIVRDPDGDCEEIDLSDVEYYDEEP